MNDYIPAMAEGYAECRMIVTAIAVEFIRNWY